MSATEKTAFFASIRDGNLSAVKLYLDKRSDNAPVSDDEGKSAAKIALESKHVEVYGMLVENGWWLSPGEDFSKLVEKFKSKEKIKLRDIHKAFIKNPNEKHLTSLITRSSIYFGGHPANANRRKYLGLIAGAYEELNDIREVRAIFKVVSNIELLNVVFDFDRDSIEHADATGKKNVNGRCYAETDGVVYIGAKPLLVDTTRRRALGVLAHELCHYAIYIKYDNDYKPFYETDKSREKEFWEVFDACASKTGIEPIVDGAISTPAKFKLDELIVRVPHLLALFEGDDEKITRLKETFTELFNFFDKITLPELEDEHELMEAVWKLKSKEPQYILDMKMNLKPKPAGFELTQVLEISSNTPQITMNMIYQEMCSRQKPKTSFIFLALYHVKDSETLALTAKAFQSCLKPAIIIDCDNELGSEIQKTVDAMNKARVNARTIFVHIYEEVLIEGSNYQTYMHSWNELATDLMEELIKRKITFQGQEITLEEIVNFDSPGLDHIPLKPLLDNYLEIGHALQFPEIGIHITRRFLNQYNNEVEFENLLSIAEEQKLILLSDDAGMGKTTELKIFAMEIKKKLRSFWVSFVDLKEFSEFYEKDENFKTSYKSAEDIASFFVDKIFKLNDFEAQIFQDLFRDGRVVLIMDGFDEISPTFNSFVTTLLRNIRSKSNNILVTSTRPHFKKLLEQAFGMKAFTLKLFSKEDRDEILKLSFIKLGFIGDALNTKLTETKLFYYNLNKNSDAVLNPLLLRLIATVFSDEKYSQSTQPNTFSIYENFIKMMIINSMNKGDEAKKEATSYFMSKFNIMPFHQKEAFKELFQNSDDDMKKNFALCFQDVQSPHTEQMQRIALMKPYGPGKFLFIHRTFTEWFVAHFLFKNVFHRKQKGDKAREDAVHEICREVFYAGESSDVFYPVRTFIDGALESSSGNIDMKVFLSTVCEVFTWRLLPLFFNRFVQDSLFHLITDITRSLDGNRRHLRKLWTYKIHSEGNYNVFMVAAKQGSLYFNSKLVELAREVLAKRDFDKLFFEKNSIGDTVAMVAHKNSIMPGVIDFYLNKTGELPSSPLHRESPEHLRSILESSFFVILKHLLMQRRFTDFQEKVDLIKSEHGSDFQKRILNSTVVEGKTIYYEACMTFKTIDEFKFIWKFLREILGEIEFRKLLHTPKPSGISPLMVKALHSEDVFNAFWDLITEHLTVEQKKALLLDEDENEYNAFDWATQGLDHKTFIAVKNLYLRTLGEAKVRIMITRKKASGRTVLHFCVPSTYDNVATVNALWEFIQHLCDEKSQKQMILQRNEHGETFYHNSMNIRYFDEKMKIFEPFIARLTEKEKNVLTTTKAAVLNTKLKVWLPFLVSSYLADVKDIFLDLFFTIFDFFATTLNSATSFLK